MLVLLSSAKTLDFSSGKFPFKARTPRFQKEAVQLNAKLKKLNRSQIGKLMDISPKLAEEVFGYVDGFSAVKTRPAILAYRGVVFQQLKIDEYSSKDFKFADSSLRIISGLYGILRPFDLIAPYRLEMATDLGDLPAFWQKKVTQALNADIKEQKAKWLVNLASVEYSSAIAMGQLKASVINIDFKEKRGGKLKTIGLLAKVARGMMADSIIRQGWKDPADLKKFKAGGYKYEPKLSSASNFVFVR